MSVSHWNRTTHSETTNVYGNDVTELLGVAQMYADYEGATWRVEGGSIRFERPLHESLVSRSEDGPAHE